ncbi:MAG TPA: nitroreductase [Bacilli bacterium]|mgnify:CR=1 FL=1|nr:nitroreductase [Bacilli bacterium]
MNNETINSILKRRSIRKYQDKQISKAEIDIIIKCGQYAPSGMNRQPWQFIAVQDPKLLKTIANKYYEYHKAKGSSWCQKENYNVFYGAPTVIFIARDKNNEMAYFDACCATENIVIAAQALGLGSCIMIDPIATIMENKKLQELLMIKENYVLHIAITLGYAAEKSRAKTVKTDNVVNL